MPRKPARPKLALKAPRRRTSYAQRTRQGSRVAVPLLSTLNGHADEHWSHETIRLALLRQKVIEADDLAAELPRPAISTAVTKGWLYRVDGEAWFHVTLRAAKDLSLPLKNNQGQRIRFLDTANLAPSAPAFPEPKKLEVTEARAAELIAQILVAGQSPMTEAKLYRAVLDETGWPAIEIARRIAGDDKKLLTYWWNHVVYRTTLLDLPAVIQNAAECGDLDERTTYEIARVPQARRTELYAAIASGEITGRKAIRELASALARE